VQTFDDHFRAKNNKIAHLKSFDKPALKTIYTIIFLFIAPFAFSAQWQAPQTTPSWKGLWGQRDENALYLGMWTQHTPHKNANKKNNVNKLIAVNLYGIFAGTFLNSFDIRSYSIGIQRIVYSKKFSHYFQIDAGYRLGVIWGYKGTPLLNGFEKIFPGITNAEAIPFPQIIGNFSWEMVGVQVSYCWSVLTFGFFVKF